MATEFLPIAPDLLASVTPLLPAGRYLLTTSLEGYSDAHVIAGVHQVSDSPPLLLVAMPKGLPLSPMIRDARHFAVGVLPMDTCTLSRMFESPAPAGVDRFLGLPCVQLPRGIRMPSRVRGWFACEMVRHLDIGGDHEIYIGLVHEAALAAPGTPAQAARSRAACASSRAGATPARKPRAPHPSRLRSRA